MIVSKYGYKRDYRGNWQKKAISELRNSHHYVIVRCNECGQILKTMWNNRQTRVAKNQVDLCGSCAKKGSRNSQHGKDRRDILRHARSFQKRNGMKDNHHTDETKTKMSRHKANLIATGAFNILSNNRGTKSWYSSKKTGQRFFADSSLELFRMIQLDSDSTVITWTKRHKIKILYNFDGIDRYCVPDFFITYSDGHKGIEEVKGRITKKETAKKNAIEMWCESNGLSFNFITQKQLNKDGKYRLFLKQQKEAK